MKYSYLAFSITILLLVSAFLITVSAAFDKQLLTLCSILIFCLPIGILADGSPLISKIMEIPPLNDRIPYRGMSRNTLLTILVYGWGSLSLLLTYSFSGLYWQHGNQYGVAAGLIATLFAIYWHYTGRVPQELSTKRILVILHGASLFLGLLYLISTGKLMTKRGDWLANYIFLSGGITQLFLCFSTWSWFKTIRL